MVTVWISRKLFYLEQGCRVYVVAFYTYEMNTNSYLETSVVFNNTHRTYASQLDLMLSSVSSVPLS
jgi:hypothetical protein